MPRNLRILVIEDGDFNELSDLDYIGPIKSWRSAIKLWCSMTKEQTPDLISADVLFEEDNTTPLTKTEGVIAGSNHIAPTGLSHAKAFLALAQFSGNIGLAFKTANAGMWGKILEKKPNHAMALLAAHEIGEIAAILGEELETIEDCWAWLRRNSSTIQFESQNSSLINFRRRLATKARTQNVPVIFPDKSWFHLLEVIDKLSKVEREKLPEAIEEFGFLDSSVTLLGPDGSKDCVYVRSIFADHKGFEKAHPKHFKYQNFEEMYFEGRSAEIIKEAMKDPDIQRQFESFDGEIYGSPAVGVFLKTIGRVADYYVEAVKRTHNPEQNYDDNLARPISTFLALVKLSHDRIESKMELGNSKTWEAYKSFFPNQEHIFLPDEQPSLSYFEYAKKIYDLIFREQDNGGATLEDIKEELSISYQFYDYIDGEESDRKLSPLGTMCKHITAKLEAAGKIYKQVDKTYVPIDDYKNADLVNVTIQPSAKDVQSYLKISDTQHFTSIARWLMDVPRKGNNQRKEGTAFWNGFITVRPPWLLELMQKYAREELRWNYKNWPTWLAAREGSGEYYE